MIKRSQFLPAILALTLFSSYAAAQDAAGAKSATDTQPAEGAREGAKSSAPAVAASAEGAKARFTATGDVLQVRLEVYAATGERVFDSGARQGSVIDWDASQAQRALADGSYLCVVTVKDLRGQSSQRLCVVTLEGGKLSLGVAREGELTASLAQALAASREAQNLGAIDAAGAVTILRDKSRAATVLAHDGADGQVASTKGALTFRTGDLFLNRAQERMRITEDGRVGIGTDKPEAALDVAGAIRARGGIRFDDGTVINSASDLGAKKSSSSANLTADGSLPTAAAVAGTGTTNNILKWTDGASGTAGDSALVETGGKIGIGTNAPQYPFHLNNSTFAQLFVSGGTAADFLLYHTNAPANARWTGLRSQNGFGKISSFSDNAAYRQENILTWNNANGNVGVGVASPQYPLHIANPTFAQLFVAGGSAADFLLYHTNAPANARWTGLRSQNGFGKISSFADNGAYNVENILTWGNATGNVALGAAPGAEKLEVTGNIKVNGVNNGIMFSDGSKMTTAAGIANPVQFVPATEQLSVGDANGTAAMINLRGGSTCCSGPGGHTPAFFKVFQNGSFLATGNLGIGVSPMQGKGYRTSWDSYKGAFRSGYADNEWDDANVGFFSWAGGSNSTAVGLYALAFGDTNSAESTSSIVFGSGNQVKGAAGFSAGAGNRVCDTYGVALGNNAKSGGPLINGRCDPDSFNIHGLAAVAIGYNVTADQDHTMAFGKFASNNGFTGTFVWSDGSATQSADTFKNTANNEFAARATGGFRFRTNLAGTTGCNLPAGSGVFNCTSSRTTKENFSLVKGEDVLTRLRGVPVSTWNYVSEGQQVRHMGPMAEDFYGAFGLGTGSTSIGVQDLAGVSLAAVKALDERTVELQRKTAEVERLRAEVDALRSANSAIERRLAALERSAPQDSQAQRARRR